MRRHLGYSIEEQGALPWWQHQLYRDGLSWEFSDKEEQPDDDESEVPLESFGVTVRER